MRHLWTLLVLLLMAGLSGCSTTSTSVGNPTDENRQTARKFLETHKHDPVVWPNETPDDQWERVIVLRITTNTVAFGPDTLNVETVAINGDPDNFTVNETIAEFKAQVAPGTYLGHTHVAWHVITRDAVYIRP